MKSQTNERRALAAICSCGGWVMLAAMGYGPDSDADNYREVGNMISEGYDIRHGSVEELRAIPACDCVHDQSRQRDTGQLSMLEE